MTNQNKCESGETSWESSWLKSKLLKTAGSTTTKPAKQTDTERYLAALYNCGESTI